MTVYKRVASLLNLPVLLLVVVDSGQARAQSSPGFTAVLYDYFGCDPAVRQATPAPAPCPPQAKYTKYVDPNIGTSTFSTVMSTQPPTSITLITKMDGTQVQVLHLINAYYSVKLNIRASGQSGANCMPAGTTSLGTETILGIETYKYQQGEVEPGNAASTAKDGTVNWLAPGLNCFSLRSEFHFKGSPTTFQMART